MTITDPDALEDILQQLHHYFATGERMPPWRETPLSFWPELVLQGGWAMGYARATADHLMETGSGPPNAAAISRQETRQERAGWDVWGDEVGKFDSGRGPRE